MLLFGIATVACLLAFSVRFGPHLVWRVSYSHTAVGVNSVPCKPLISNALTEEVVSCHVGPFSFELPRSMANPIDVRRGIGGVNLQFGDGERTLILNLTPLENVEIFPLADFPDKPKLTYARAYKEILTADSHDFSFAMSRDEFRWHKWLLTNRTLIPETIESMEFHRSAELEGNLLFAPSFRCFDWATIDGTWKGTIHFQGSPQDDLNWARHVCTTFAINGDPKVFLGKNDAAIKSLVTTSTLESVAN